MTREVAIKAIQDFIGWFKEDSLIRKALEMAIQTLSKEPTVQDKQAESEKYQKAFDDGYANGYSQARFDYEQEPCDDVISLTKEAYSDLCLRASKADDLQRALDMEKGAYNALVKNIQCEDAISRDAVIDLYDRYRPSLATHVSEFGDELKALPSVTPICEERKRGECPYYAG
jgi:hypothetical protein